MSIVQDKNARICFQHFIYSPFQFAYLPTSLFKSILMTRPRAQPAVPLSLGPADAVPDPLLVPPQVDVPLPPVDAAA